MRKKRSGRRIKKIAAKSGVPAVEVVSDMQIAIDATWNNPDPAARNMQRELFPNGKPSVEEFINVIAKNRLRNKP